MPEWLKSVSVLSACALVSVLGDGARAESDADFYKRHPLTISVGSSAASGFSVYARLLSRHFDRHVPGRPKIIIENLPGASGLRHLEYMVSVAPKDGSAIGLLNPGTTTARLLRPDTVKHDTEKLAWLGSANSEVSTCLVWPRSGVEKAADLKNRPLAMGVSGGAGSSFYGTHALKDFFGFPWKIVTGYQGSAGIMLAGARGEIDGTCILLTSALKSQYWDRYQKGEFKVILQMPPGNHPDLKGVANTVDLAETEEQRQVLELIYGSWAYGRPFAAPAGVPAQRLAALRTALKATLEDPRFLAEAKKIGVTVDYMPPEVIEQRVKAIQSTPEPIVAKVRALISK